MGRMGEEEVAASVASNFQKKPRFLELLPTPPDIRDWIWIVNDPTQVDFVRKPKQLLTFIPSHCPRSSCYSTQTKRFGHGMLDSNCNGKCCEPTEYSIDSTNCIANRRSQLYRAQPVLVKALTAAQCRAMPRHLEVLVDEQYM